MLVLSDFWRIFDGTYERRINCDTGDKQSVETHNIWSVCPPFETLDEKDRLHLTPGFLPWLDEMISIYIVVMHHFPIDIHRCASACEERRDCILGHTVSSVLWSDRTVLSSSLLQLLIFVGDTQEETQMDNEVLASKWQLLHIWVQENMFGEYTGAFHYRYTLFGQQQHRA